MSEAPRGTSSLALFGTSVDDTSTKCCANLTKSLGCVTDLALFIIGCIGAAGVLPGSTVGWVVVGLAGGSFVLNFSLGNFSNRKFELILFALSAAAITFGALGGTGIFSASQVGLGIIGTSLASTLLSCALNRCSFQTATQPQSRLHQRSRMSRQVDGQFLASNGTDEGWSIRGRGRIVGPYGGPHLSDN